MGFTLHSTAPGSRARRGTLTTAHGEIATPVFMPVGTRGTVRTQTLAQLQRLGAPILLANTYHLLVRPGPDVLERFGGLHRWMGWTGALLTDSGGFQIFSLSNDLAISEDGARFERDGQRVVLTPERSIAMQQAIGSDIMMVLDQCIPATSPRAQALDAMQRTHRWARRSLAAHQASRVTTDGGEPHRQQLFAIVQGGCLPELRRDSAAELTSIDGFDGYAIGGLAVGETRAQRQDLTELTAELLPVDRPRYLMGVGTPVDLLEAVHRGVDMFDCILPTAWAQHGKAFTSRGRVDLRRGVYRLSDQPLDAACACEACTLYARSYLHHLVRCGEPLGWQLLAFHNLAFYGRLMRELRGEITDGTFAARYAERQAVLAASDVDNPPGPRSHARAPRASSRGAFALHTSSQGFTSIAHVASGEVMHSVNEPDVEADRIYVAQSALLAHARTGGRPITVWDVGLGAAHNAMAVIRALDASPGHAAVELVSFERDLDAFRLALAHTGPFAHLRHPAPHVLAHRGEFVRDRVRWVLVEGDFLAGFAGQPPPDVILYDPFSAKVDGPMWSLATFRALFAHLDRATELFTYSASTAVRSSLLAAGFRVGPGVGSGPKSETTIALAGDDPALAGHALLDHAWLARRARSTAAFGPDVPIEQRGDVERAIRSHPQFRTRAPDHGAAAPRTSTAEPSREP